MRGRGYDAGFLGDGVDPAEIITNDDGGRRGDSLVAADSSSVVPTLLLSHPSQLRTNPSADGRRGCGATGHSFVFIIVGVVRFGHLGEASDDLPR
jgi:hypothetical protein